MHITTPDLKCFCHEDQTVLDVCKSPIKVIIYLNYFVTQIMYQTYNYIPQ